MLKSEITLPLKLSHPLTEEQMDAITDADLDHTTEITFYTKHGKVVTFVKKKVGKWILADWQIQEEMDNGNYCYNCSNCGKADIHAKSAEVPFCWWCGADMRGEEDNEDIPEGSL